MRNQLSLFIIFILIGLNHLSAQGSYSEPTQGFSMEGKTHLNLGSMMGRPFTVNNYDNIKGTPYFLDSSFRLAHVMLSNGKLYTVDKLRLNLLTHQLHFLTGDNAELVAGDGIIKKVIFYTRVKDSIVPVIFASGFPAVDKYTNLSYYEELNQGKIRALKILEKVIAKDLNITANPLDKHFEEHTNFYLYNADLNKIVHWKKGTDFILDFIGDKKEVLLKYIKDKDLNCRSISDVTELLTYYNSL